LKSKFEIGKKYELSAKTQYLVTERTDKTVNLARIIDGKNCTEKSFSVVNKDGHEYIILDIWNKHEDCYYELFSYQTLELAERIFDEKFSL